MNFFKKSLLLLESVVLCCLVSCDKSGTSNNSTDYSKVIVGHWFNTGTADNNLVELSLGAKNPNSASYYDLIDQDWGVMAFGTFELNGNKLTIVFDDVQVTDENRKKTSRNGFTDSVSRTVSYTILGCDGKNLYMVDDEQNRSAWEN